MYYRRKELEQYNNNYITPLLKNDCAICLEKLTVFPKKANLKVKCTKCQVGVHVFHKHCLDKHINYKSEYDCPVCRSEHPYLVEMKLSNN